MYKNLPKQVVLQLKDLVQYQPGQVVSRTLVQNDRVSMTLFSFDQGEEISAHASGGDAMVTVLEGRGRVTIGGEGFLLSTGETIVMPKDIPHAVYGEESFKMLLIVSFLWWDIRFFLTALSREFPRLFFMGKQAPAHD